MEAFVALTDKHWFDHLERLAGVERRVDEVNFWSPSSTQPLKRLTPGDPVFFRLKAPHHCIAGYGFFAHFALLSLSQAWSWFGEKNGDPDQVRFLERIGAYRRVDLLDPKVSHDPLGCTILRDARFWPRDRWIPWGIDRGWKPNIVRGKTERDPARSSRLLGEIQFDHQGVPEEFERSFELIKADERTLRLAANRPREGQGAFRTRLLDAYDRRCAITGEQTEIVLEAAHIQPYLGPRSNHVQNGLLLTREFHALFDAGYVTVTPEYEVRVSKRLRADWDNGHRYYPFDNRQLNMPSTTAQRPSQEVLEWHSANRFLG